MKKKQSACLPTLRTSLRKCLHFARERWHQGIGEKRNIIKMLILNDSGKRGHVKSIQSSPLLRRIKQSGFPALHSGSQSGTKQRFEC